jgi:hypothetical protein
VISLASSTGVSPSRARFVPVADVGPPKLKGSFLSIDVPLKGADESDVKVKGGRLYLATGTERPLLDVNGLGRAGLLEVAQVGRDTGAIYRTLSREAPAIGMPLALSAGNVAVIGMSGLRAEINTTDPSGQDMVREVRPVPKGRGHLWLPAMLMIAAGAALLAHALRMYKRKASEAGHGSSG